MSEPIVENRICKRCGRKTTILSNGLCSRCDNVLYGYPKKEPSPWYPKQVPEKVYPVISPTYPGFPKRKIYWCCNY